MAAAMRRSKRAGGKACGPSRTNWWVRTAASAASPEATSSVWRQGRSVRPRIRCGVAEPTVSAPTRMPMASPRPSLNPALLDHLALPEAGDLLGLEPEVLQNRLGVLAAQRRRRADRARGLGELDGDTKLAHAPVRGMLDVDDHLAMV